MIPHVVLYILISEGIVPQVFVCAADDSDHAEEQCLDAYPGADVVWIEPGGAADIQRIYENYLVEA